jgi:hypothetical protein
MFHEVAPLAIRGHLTRQDAEGKGFSYGGGCANPLEAISEIVVAGLDSATYAADWQLAPR